MGMYVPVDCFWLLNVHTLIFGLTVLPFWNTPNGSNIYGKYEAVYLLMYILPITDTVNILKWV